MFAPKLARSQTRASTHLVRNPMPHRAAVQPRPFGGPVPGQEAEPFNTTDGGTTRRVSWDFSNVPAFARNGAEAGQTPYAGVQVLSDARAAGFLRDRQAVAATIDRDTVLVDPAFRKSDRVISHELAHVAQLRSGRSASRTQAEAEATRSSMGEFIAPARSVGAATPPMFLTIAEQIAAAPGKGEVFDLLRAQPLGSANTADVSAAIQKRFGNSPDDLWLAKQLQQLGAEPVWPAALMTERTKRAAANHWLPEAGNIGADLTTPGETQ